MSQIEDKVNERVDEIRRLLANAPHLHSASLSDLYGTEPYRALVKLGGEALPALLDHLREGDVFLNRAVLEISGIQLAELQLDNFPSEQEISAALNEALVVVEISATAAGKVPQSLTPAEVKLLWKEDPKPLQRRVFNQIRGSNEIGL